MSHYFVNSNVLSYKCIFVTIIVIIVTVTTHLKFLNSLSEPDILKIHKILVIHQQFFETFNITLTLKAGPFNI